MLFDQGVISGGRASLMEVSFCSAANLLSISSAYPHSCAVGYAVEQSIDMKCDQADP
jgi:hypothetical protein